MLLAKPSACLVTAHIGFVLFLIPCIILLPQIFREDLGMSNYGVSRLTVIPYSLGFLMSAFFTWLAASRTPNPTFRRSLRIVAILQLALLAVPDSHLNAVRYAHIAIGMSLFVAEFSLATWLAITRRKEYALLFLQALAGISAFLSLGQVLPFEAPSQLAFQLSFMWILIRSARQSERNADNVTFEN